MNPFLLILECFHLFLRLRLLLSTFLTRCRCTLLYQLVLLASLLKSPELLIFVATGHLLGRHLFSMGWNLWDSLQIAQMIVSFLGCLDVLLMLYLFDIRGINDIYFRRWFLMRGVALGLCFFFIRVAMFFWMLAQGFDFKFFIVAMLLDLVRFIKILDGGPFVLRSCALQIPARSLSFFLFFLNLVRIFIYDIINISSPQCIGHTLGAKLYACGFWSVTRMWIYKSYIFRRVSGLLFGFLLISVRLGSI